jgi:ADP-heptose:LPS heptosyltransferase
MTKLAKPLNILVKRRAAIGDVIMTTGIVRELNRKYGDNAKIYVATDCIEVYKNNPHIAGTLYVDSVSPDQMAVFDVVYNLDDAYEYDPDIHFVDSYFYRVFGDANMNKSVELYPAGVDYVSFNKIKQQHSLEKYIVVHMRNWHWQAKNISLDVWFDVFTKLFEERDDFKIVTIGGHTDHTVEHPNFVDLRTAGLNSQQMKILCDEAACFVGIDSGPFQCAAASNTHIIALLTHLRPERIIPDRKWERGHNTTVIQTEEECRGCADRQQLPVRQINCQHGDYRCTNNFDTQAIADAILKTL